MLGIRECQRESIPIIASHHPVLDEAEKARLIGIAARFLRDEHAFVSSRNFHPLVQQGSNSCPAIIFGDQREINLYAQSSSFPLDYRMALLAQPGDTVFVAMRDKAFEQYLARYIEIAGVTFVAVGDPHPAAIQPVSVRCRTEKRLRRMIESTAHRGRGLVVVPYLTTGNAWRLAEQIAVDTGMPISVCGPAPRISTRVNDKLWFIDCVRQVIGEHGTPPVFAAYGPAAAAAHIARLSQKSARIVVKVPDSAGSAGNVAFESEEVTGLPLHEMRQKLISVLHGKTWRNSYPILIGIWECNVISSPSVQVWIPLPETGPPVIEGIFDQMLHGAEGTFIGATRANLPDDLTRRLVSEASQLAIVFQRLGYFGRCSLDSIISPRQGNSHQVYWIECNGRWGGVSLPMTLANRLNGGVAPRGLVIVQQSKRELPPRSTREIIHLWSDILFKRGSTRSGIVLLSPSDQATCLKMNFMAIGPDQRMAEELSDEAIARIRY